MIKQIAEKLLIKNGINKDDISEFRNIEGDFSENLKNAMDLAIEEIEQEVLSQDEKFNKNNIVKENVKYSLLLDFVHDSSEKATEENLSLDEYLSNLQKTYKKGVYRATTINFISIFIIAIIYLCGKCISRPINYSLPLLLCTVVGLILFAISIFVFTFNSVILKKMTAMQNLVDEAIKEVCKDNSL